MTAVTVLAEQREKRARRELHDAAMGRRAAFLTRIVADLAAIPNATLDAGTLEDCRALLPYLSEFEAAARVRVLLEKARLRNALEEPRGEVERQDYEEACETFTAFALAAVEADEKARAR